MKKLLHKRVLVVGTTADYIDWIRQASPGRCLFITDPAVRHAATEKRPEKHEEILVPLNDPAVVRAALDRHLERHHIRLSGITCYDCEHLWLTAELAGGLGLVYPGRKAVDNARDKYLSKQIWQAAGVDCPAVALVNAVEDAQSFLAGLPHGIVLKPVAGSGSELVFQCRQPQEVAVAFSVVQEELKTRTADPLFRSGRPDLMLAEEMIPGPEYSCDFIMGSDTARIIRVTKKIKPRHLPFGTTAGYVLVANPAAHLDMDMLRQTMYRAAGALGIHSGICMADFILARDRGESRAPVLIEMTPRPGGDCLPHLLKQAGNLDIISLALDVAVAAAEGKIPILNGSLAFTPMVAMKILADRGGTLKNIDLSGLNGDKRIREIYLSKQPGHKVVMPPHDYDSRVLGHITFLPDNPAYPETLSKLISLRVKVEMDQ
ncbi:MAG: ATP-grasp domain-containing protein [Desulfobacter sp.]|nr:MAG: ATP-grasp domain-containing protein [Desulfobacter sp.]